MKIVFLASLLILTFLTGCAAIGEQGDFSSQGSMNGQLSLFLNGPDRSTTDVTFNLAAINIVAEDGTKRELMGAPLDINSAAMVGRQIVLSERMLPEGAYKKLQFVIKEASIKRKDRIATPGFAA